MSPSSNHANRYFIAIGTADYDHLPHDAQLPSVRDDLARMVQLFINELGYKQALNDLYLNPEHEQLRKGLSRWMRDKTRTAEDIVVIYYAGHGEIEGDRHYLCTRDSEQGYLLDSALPSEDLARMLIESPIQQLLVILDTCHAGAGIGNFADLFYKISAPFKVDDSSAAGIYLIAAVGPKQEATGIFAQAFIEAVHNPVESYAAPTQPYLALEAVIGVVRSKLGKEGGERAELSSARIQEAPPFLRNPKFDPNYRDNRKLITIYQGAQYARPNYRNNISALLNLYSEPFVGRIEELTKLAAFAVSPAGSYLLLEAPAGYGKSALIAYMILRHEKGGSLLPNVRILYFFIRSEGNNNTSSAFYEAINSQLLSLLGLEGGVPNDKRELRKQFSQLWAEATQQADREHPLLLLIDSLDESSIGVDSIIAELPNGLCDYVHVIVTSRPNPDPLAQVSPEHPFHQLVILRLNTFSTAEISILLEQKQLDLTLTQKVLDLTQGEPLFVRFIVQDIADKGTAALDKIEEQAPDGVENYFRYQFRQLDQAAEDNLIWDILGLLISIRGGIELSEIADLWKMTNRRVRRAIEPIQRYLIGREQIMLMHMQLRKVLLSEFSDRERIGYKQAVLQWAQHYQSCGWPRNTPTYLLNHYAGHLAEADDRDGLAALFSNHQWLHARVPAANYEYDGYIADLMLTWERTHTLIRYELETGQPSSTFLDCVRYTLIRTTINSLAAEYDASLVARAVETGIWSPSRALSVASKIPNKHERIAFITTILATKSFQEISNQEIRRRAEKEGVAAALAIQEEEFQAGILVTLTPHLSVEAQERALQAGLAAARTIHDEAYRADALAVLAPHLKGYLQQEGLAAALTIGDEWSRADALAALAPYLNQQLLQEGLTAARAIQNEQFRAKVLAALAPQLSEGVQEYVLQEGLAAVLTIQDERPRADALVALAPYLNRQLLQEGLTAARKIQNERSRAYVLTALTPYLSKEEQDCALQEGLSATLAIQDERHRADALVALAPYLNEQLLQEGLIAARKIQNERSRAYVLATLAPYLSGEEQECVLQDGLIAALKIQDERFRARSLASLAPHLHGQLLQQGLAAIHDIQDERFRADALTALVPCLNDEAQERALQDGLAALAIQDSQLQSDTLTALAPYLSGQILEQGLLAALAIQDEEFRAKALAALAPGLSGHLLQQGLMAALVIQDEVSRAKALAVLASYLSGEDQKRALQKSLVVACTIQDERSRADVLMDLIPLLSGQLLQETLASVLVIQDERSRSDVLATLAPYLKEQSLQEGLTATFAIQDKAAQVYVLAMLVPRLSDEVQEHALQEGLTAACTIHDERQRAQALTALAPYLSGQLLQEALTAAQSIQDMGGQAEVLAALAPRLKDDLQEYVLLKGLAAARSIQDEQFQARILTMLAPHLRGQLLQDALTTIQISHDVRSRSDALAAVASCLSGEVQEHTLQLGLATACTIQDERERAHALVALAPYLRGQLLQEGITAALAIKDNRAQVRLLAALAPNLDGEAQEYALQKGLATACTIQDEAYRVEALIALARHLKGHLLKEGLAAVLAIRHERFQVDALVALMPYLNGEMKERAIRAGLTAVDAIQDKGFRSYTLAKFVPIWPKNASFLQQIRQAVTDTLIFRLQDQPRSNVLEFCANTTLFSPSIFPTEILEGITKLIIEICEEWEWL